MRRVERRYVDPLDTVWLGVAARLGLRVARSEEVYASTDGRGRLAIGTQQTLDADDCLAQMVFHELCHALVEGPGSWALPDWGFELDAEALPRERACLRLQAALADRHGLRGLLAPTTEHRAFYDALGEDPLAGDPVEDPSLALARAALPRAEAPPVGPVLQAGLAATSAIARAAAPFARAAERAGAAEEAPAPTLWRELPARHPTGDALGEAAGGCSDCAWRYRARSRERCRVQGVPVDVSWPACARWEPALDCVRCSACCREAYGSVTVSARDPVVRRHPALVVRREGYLELARAGPDCGALRRHGDGRDLCAIYDDRPRCCRAFERGGRHCLEARRRVGLSPR